jgi:hypothetical protein
LQKETRRLLISLCSRGRASENFAHFAWFGEPCKEYSYGKVKGVIFLTDHNKEGLICWYKSIMANFCKFVLTKFQVNIKFQILKYTNRLFLYQTIGHVSFFVMGKRPSSVRSSVTFSHLNLLLWNRWTEISQTCQKCSLVPISKRFTSLVQDHPMIIPAKPQFNWLSGF